MVIVAQTCLQICFRLRGIISEPTLMKEPTDLAESSITPSGRLFHKPQLLHQSLRLRVVTAEVAIDDSLVFHAALFEDFLAEGI